MSTSVETEAAKLAADRDPPDPAALASEEEKKAAQRREWESLTDKDGGRWDPAVHQRNPDGSPRLTQKGNLLRKGGFHSRAKARPPKSSGSTVGAEGERSQPAVEPRVLATMLVDTSTGFACMVMRTKEWAPIQNETLDERTTLIDATEAYVKANDIEDVPPGLMLVFAVCGYAFPRLYTPDEFPETAKRLDYWSTRSRPLRWIRGYWRRLLGKGDDAQPDLRTDPERKDDVRTGSRPTLAH